MSRKHYRAIAEMLRQHIVGGTTPEEIATATAIAMNLTGFLKEDNRKFDRARFLTAVGL